MISSRVVLSIRIRYVFCLTFCYYNTDSAVGLAAWRRRPLARLRFTRRSACNPRKGERIGEDGDFAAAPAGGREAVAVPCSRTRALGARRAVEPHLDSLRAR